MKGVGMPHDRRRPAVEAGHRTVRGTAPAGSVSGAAREALAHVLPTLISDLGLGDLVAPLVPDDKPRVVLHFHARPDGRAAALGSDVVLKVYGDTPRGEGSLQARWHEGGVPTPRTVFGERGGCSWLLMEHVDMVPAPASSADERLRLTDALAATGSVMHQDAPELTSVLRPLSSVMMPRWDAAADALRASGRPVPEPWRTLSEAAYHRGPRRPLHGDLALTNVAHDRSGGLVIYDASALYGPPAFDAARWAARLSTADLSPRDVLQRWHSIEPVDLDSAHALLGAECVLEAGSREAVHARSALGDAHGDDTHEGHVRRLLQEAADLLTPAPSV